MSLMKPKNINKDCVGEVWCGWDVVRVRCCEGEVWCE